MLDTDTIGCPAPWSKLVEVGGEKGAMPVVSLPRLSGSKVCSNFVHRCARQLPPAQLQRTLPPQTQATPPHRSQFRQSREKLPRRPRLAFSGRSSIDQVAVSSRASNAFTFPTPQSRPFLVLIPPAARSAAMARGETCPAAPMSAMTAAGVFREKWLAAVQGCSLVCRDDKTFPLSLLQDEP